MRKLVLPYQRRHNEQQFWEELPMCSLSLIGPARTVPVKAVIDSGATHPFFLTNMAEDAGIDLSKARPFLVTWGGSKTEGKLMDVYIRIATHRMNVRVVFVDHIALGYALLGRTGFFSKFNEVTFLERHNENKRVELRF